MLEPFECLKIEAVARNLEAVYSIVMKQVDAANADLNLLFGVLAIQLDFIKRDALLDGMNAWVLNKSKTLGEILVSQGSLTPDRRALLDTLVKEHLRTHQNTPEQSLAALAGAEQLRTILEPVRDSDVHASIMRVPSRPTAHARVERTLGPEEMPGAGIGGGAVFATQTLQPSTPSSARFRIVRLHAKGGLGEVFVAIDGEIQREVALKHIQDRFADDEGSRQRFVSEAEITGSLEHPSIVPVYGLGQYPNGRPYYAMRFIRGDSLKEAIDHFHKLSAQDGSFGTHRREFRQLLNQFVAVCNAIDYAHSRKVIHRDLKPSNIMLGKYGETFVVDWGLAKAIDAEEISGLPKSDEAPLSLSVSNASNTQMGTQVGTPQFMSPEQAAGQNHLVGFASDIYCLGATFYYLLTGSAPLTDSDVWLIMGKVQKGDFPPPRERNRKVPKVLEAICLRAMQLDPAKRHSTAGKLAEEIDCWLADEPVASYTETSFERIMRWTRRHRAWTQAIMGSVFIVAIVASVSTILISQARQAELKALGQAQDEREKAEENFLKARTTVDEFFTRVSETKLLNAPGVQPLRQELLRDALAYYQGFVEKRGDDPKLQAEMAATYYRIALITDELGQKSEAIRTLERAYAIQQDLIKEDPNNIEQRFALADTLNKFGDFTLSLGEAEKALDYFKQAKDHRELLAKEDPKNAQYQRKLLNSYDNIAVAQAEMGSPREAIVNYEQANLARSRLALDNPGVQDFERDLARGYFNLAQLQIQVEDYDAAVKTMENSASIFQKLVKQNPKSIEYAQQLVMSRRAMGDLQRFRGDVEKAGVAYQQSRDLSHRLASENPLVAEFRLDLVRADVNLARWLEIREEFAKSADVYNEAIALLRKLVTDHPTNEDYSAELATLLLERGGLFDKMQLPEEACQAIGDAEAVYEQLVQNSPGSIELHTMLARVRTQLGMALDKAKKIEAGLGKMQTALAALESARPKLTDTKQIDLQLSDVYAGMADVLEKNERREEAIAALRKGIALRAKVSKDLNATPGDLAAWAYALEGLSYMLLDAGRKDDALTTSEEANTVLLDARKRFPESVDLVFALANNYLQRIDIEGETERYDRIPDLAEKLMEATDDPQIVLELARRLARTCLAAKGKPGTETSLANMQDLALAACREVLQGDPKVLAEFRANPDFEAFQDLPAWKMLLEGK